MQSSHNQQVLSPNGNPVGPAAASFPAEGTPRTLHGPNTTLVCPGDECFRRGFNSAPPCLPSTIGSLSASAPAHTSLSSCATTAPGLFISCSIGGTMKAWGPVVGFIGVQLGTAQGEADGKRCNPTAESPRGAPRPGGPVPVTARRRCLAQRLEWRPMLLDGAPSTVPRYSAIAAWRTSPRRDPGDPAIE